MSQLVLLFEIASNRHISMNKENIQSSTCIINNMIFKSQKSYSSHLGSYTNTSTSTTSSLNQFEERKLVRSQSCIISLRAKQSEPDKVLLKSLTTNLPNVKEIDCKLDESRHLQMFSEEFYARISQFLDTEGLDICEAEPFPKGFKKIINLKLIEHDSTEKHCTNPSQLTCFRAKSASSEMPINVQSSKIFQRRASIAQQSITKLCLVPTYSDDNFMTPKSRSNVQQLHDFVGLKPEEKLDFGIKDKLRTLLSMDSCDFQSESFDPEALSRLSDCSPASIFRSPPKVLSRNGLSPSFSSKVVFKYTNGSEAPLSPESKCLRQSLSSLPIDRHIEGDSPR